MNRFIKIAIVLGGYVLALLVAVGGCYLRSLLRPDSLTQTAPNMFAFGDELFLVGLFVLGCIPPTALGLWFLRKNTVFWNLAALAILVFAATAPLAEGMRAFIKAAGLYESGDWMWVDVVCLLRTLAIPLLVIGDGVCLLIAPAPRIRLVLAIAVALEAVTGFYILILIMFSHRFF